METIYLGAGCFWCTEALFKRIQGVKEVVPGYAGGSVVNPSYEEVSSGNTGHAEVVKVTFDPKEISVEKLLAYFWLLHDPTTLNQQGADRGTQYRSMVLYTSLKQKMIAEKLKEELERQKVYPKPMVTEIQPFSTFYPAEKEHLDYYMRNSEKPYCQFVIKPKLEKLDMILELQKRQ